MVKVGIWGCGGISSFHRRAYAELEKSGLDVKLVALCDINKENFNKEMKINISSGNESPLPVINNCYTDIDDMLKNEELDLVDICLPTFLHKEASIKILEKGINVLVEKPMAVSGNDCDEMLEAARKSKGKLMVGQCVRFMKHYSFLKEIVENKKYGALVSAEFSRLSQYPEWRIGKSDAKKDGGVIFDMHIHDVDFVQYLFGMPKEIFAVSANNRSDYDTVSTLFKYDEGFVHVKADWGLPQSFEFSTPYRVNFEMAAIEFNGKDKILLYKDNESTVIDDIEITQSYIKEEIAYFLDIIKNDKENTKNPPEQSMLSVKLAEKIFESCKSNLR